MSSTDERTAPRPVTPAGILAARLAELARAVDDRAEIDARLRAEITELAALAGGLEPYVEHVTSPASTALDAVAARTRHHDWAGTDARGLGLEQEMLSGHVEGQLLALLVAVTRATNVLEIGTFTGYATVAMAEALPPDGQVVTCELDPDVAEFARAGFTLSPAGARIDLRVGPAAQTLADLATEGRRFEVVFVDADKAGYERYVDAVLAGRLLAPHGVLCIDNTLMQGRPWTGPTGVPAGADPADANGAAVARFNEYLRADTRVEQVLVPLRDGVTLARWADPASVR